MFGRHPLSMYLHAVGFLLTSTVTLSCKRTKEAVRKDLQTDTLCMALLQLSFRRGALGHTFLSALRSHLGQKELIRQQRWQGCMSVNSAYVKTITVTNGINLTALLTQDHR